MQELPVNHWHCKSQLQVSWQRLQKLIKVFHCLKMSQVIKNCDLSISAAPINVKFNWYIIIANVFCSTTHCLTLSCYFLRLKYLILYCDSFQLVFSDLWQGYIDIDSTGIEVTCESQLQMRWWFKSRHGVRGLSALVAEPLPQIRLLLQGRW